MNEDEGGLQEIGLESVRESESGSLDGSAAGARFRLMLWQLSMCDWVRTTRRSSGWKKLTRNAIFA